jgi:hypothetical protein
VPLVPRDRQAAREPQVVMELESLDQRAWVQLDQPVPQAHRALELEARELVRQAQWDQRVLQDQRGLELEARERDPRVRRESRV